MSEQMSYSAHVPMYILTDNNLSSTEKLVYAIVSGLSKKNGVCWASNAYISELLNLKKDTVSRVVSNLVDKGYMKRKEFRNENNQVVKRLLSTAHSISSILPDFNEIGVLDFNETPIGDFSNTSPKKSLVDTLDYTNNDTSIKKENIKRKKKEFTPPSLEEVKLFFREKGYSSSLAERAFNYYELGNWHDKNNKPVLNWKLKMSNWFNDGDKLQDMPGGVENPEQYAGYSKYKHEDPRVKKELIDNHWQYTTKMFLSL